MALGGRISPDALLNNRQRAQIVAAIRARPGIHLRETQRETGLAWGELAHHVRLLQRAAIVRMVRIRTRTHLFLAGESPRVPDPTLGATATRVLTEIDNDGGVTSAEIATTLGISPRLARYHIQRLLEQGEIASDEGHPPGYWTAGALR